jgi:hypothetical protein
MFLAGSTNVEVCVGWGNAKAFVSQGSHIAGIVTFLKCASPYRIMEFGEGVCYSS